MAGITKAYVTQAGMPTVSSDPTARVRSAANRAADSGERGRGAERQHDAAAVKNVSHSIDSFEDAARRPAHRAARCSFFVAMDGACFLRWSSSPPDLGSGGLHVARRTESRELLDTSSACREYDVRQCLCPPRGHRRRDFRDHSRRDRLGPRRPRHTMPCGSYGRSFSRFRAG